MWGCGIFGPVLTRNPISSSITRVPPGRQISSTTWRCAGRRSGAAQFGSRMCGSDRYLEARNTRREGVLGFWRPCGPGVEVGCFELLNEFGNALEISRFETRRGESSVFSFQWAVFSGQFSVRHEPHRVREVLGRRGGMSVTVLEEIRAVEGRGRLQGGRPRALFPSRANNF